MARKKKKAPELKIMVVDDSEFSRNSVRDILESNGYNVVGTAESAEEGTVKGANSGANLYLIDVVMPERSGLEMAKVITENSMGVYIIIMSSLQVESIIIESISAGAIDFLQKPFDPDMLLKAVGKIQEEIQKDL